MKNWHLAWVFCSMWEKRPDLWAASWPGSPVKEGLPDYLHLSELFRNDFQEADLAGGPWDACNGSCLWFQGWGVSIFPADPRGITGCVHWEQGVLMRNSHDGISCSLEMEQTLMFSEKFARGLPYIQGKWATSFCVPDLFPPCCVWRWYEVAGHV